MNAFAARRAARTVPAGLVTMPTSPDVVLCTTRNCAHPATATVLVGNTRLPACFACEREYADRFGPTDIHPLS